MLRRTAALTAVALLAGLLGVGGISPASADGGPCAQAGCPGPGTGGSTDDNAGTVTVTVTGSTSGSKGDPVEIPRHHTTVAPICFYRFLLSGKDYAALWGPTGNFTYLQHHLPEEDRFTPYPDYLKHKDDADGGYWYPTCDSERWKGNPDEFTAFQRKFWDTHKTVYVEADDIPPGVAEVQPADLAAIAYEQLKSMKLPHGDIMWNPRSKGGGATFVGFDTWVWLDNPATSVWVKAEIPTGTSATVTATFTDMTLSSPGAAAGKTCKDPGTPWADGATSDCTLRFARSSAGQPTGSGTLPTWTVTAVASWGASWTSEPPTGVHALQAVPVTATAEIPVAEIQANSTQG